MPRIIGIDPGSRITGFAVLDVESARQHRYIVSGCIRLQGDEVGSRLHQLFRQLGEIIGEFKPDEFAIEQVFVRLNPNSALKLGQARGVAICAGAAAGLAMAEYAPRRIKQTVTGTGAASKEQVQAMVVTLLGLTGRPQADAADALAVAICHAHHRAWAALSQVERPGGRK